MLLERKHLVIPAEFKADAKKRQVEGYASTFNNVDHGGDMVMPGAYTKTIAEDLPAGRIKVKRNHELLIGKPVHAEQDSKGLLTVSRISETDLGNETLVLVQDGVIDSMSIGYVPLEKAYDHVDGRKVRQLKSIRLFEWSLLDEPPMNDQATVTGVKSLADVGCALDQMSSALWHLRALGSTPPDVLKRLVALAAEIEPLLEAAENSADEATINSVFAALTELQSVLTPATSSASA